MTQEKQQDKNLSKEERQRILQEYEMRERMSKVKKKVLVLSGKGGVGKSTVAVNLALALKHRGMKVGLLDVDIHGPSVPTLLQLEGRGIHATEEGVKPVDFHGLKVMSVAFMMPPGEDTAVIWRGPLKMRLIEQFLKDVNWGDLDYLVVDAPPGTGDEPLSVGQMLPESVALIVTTPQRVSTVDVRKSINFCRQLNLPILGVVENMSGMMCPHCGKRVQVFPAGEAEKMTQEMDVPFLGALPLDPSVAAAADRGEAFGADDGSHMAGFLKPIVEAVRLWEPPRSSDAAEPGDDDGWSLKV